MIDQLLLLLVGLAFGATSFACYRWTIAVAYLVLGGRLWMHLLTVGVLWGAQMVLLLEVLDLLLTHVVSMEVRRAGSQFTMIGFVGGMLVAQHLDAYRRKRRDR